MDSLRKGRSDVISADPQAIETWLFSFVRSDAPRGREAQVASEAFLRALDDPQDRVRAVHIVGTAGKGTVAQLMARELRRNGVSVGLHQSPHVYDIRERFTVADDLPSWDDVAVAANEIQRVVDQGHEPTFFAVTFAMALVLARHAETDVLVIEAGIGGRFDATNTFHRHDVLTVVTAIGLDHQDVLGQTVDDIAVEKAAVLAGRSWVVLGPQPDPAAERLVEASARIHDNRLVRVHATGDWRHDAVATARAALLWFLPKVGALGPIDQPGRAEVYQVGGRRGVFDGAHNPMKLNMLGRLLAKTDQPRLGVVSVGAGKDLDGCAREIAAMVDTALVVEFGPEDDGAGPRSHRSAAIERALRAAGLEDIEAVDSTEVADRVAGSDATTVVVTGSFLHLADVRASLPGF
ncbi:MAG: hypothetical protein AAGC53_16645 [Actinomycetota bacterium]